MYEAVTFGKQEKCSEKKMKYQEIWFNYSVILMNIFLAIINDTYSLVKTEIAVQKNDVEISEFVMRGYNNLVGNMSQRDREVDLENALLMSRADNGDINYEELRQATTSCI